MLARDIEMFIEHCGLKGLSTKTINSYEQTLRLFMQYIIDRFNQRAYQPNGAGGLFTLISPNVDMRQLDIWYQLMAYLNESNM